MRKTLFSDFSFLIAIKFMALIILAETSIFFTAAEAGDISNQQTAQAMSNAPRGKAMPAPSEASIQEVSTLVKKPSTPEELLRNIKFAIDRNLLVNIDFYTIENLEKFFGGNANIEFVKKENGELEILSTVSNLKNVFVNARKDLGTTIDFYLKRENSDEGKIDATVIIPGTSNDPRLTPDLVDDVFSVGAEVEVENSPSALSGKEISDRLRAADPKGPAPFVGYGYPAMHKLGNKRVEYVFAKSEVKTTIAFVTFSAGQIKNIVINQSYKK